MNNGNGSIRRNPGRRFSPFAALGAFALFAPAALAGGQSLDHAAPFIVRKPADTLTYKIVLDGHVDKRSPANTPKKQQWRDVVAIHRVVEVKTTMFRAPRADGPGCGRACGDDWSEKALERLQADVNTRCGGDSGCSIKTMSAGTNRITTLANLQSLADDGPTWAEMTPCTVTASVNDTETLTRYIHADETPNPGGKDPGLVTRKGTRSGSMKNVNCAKALDRGYVIYITVPKHVK
ncbi:MAG: hypothetical protein ACRESR_07120, partial [Gammaproteobacteria bacterium]